MWTSANEQDAYFWHKMGTLWPFFVATVLNFTLVFTNNKWIKKRRNYLVLYLPAVAFWLLDLFTNEINAPPVLKYWGFNDVTSNGIFYYLSSVWTAVLPIIGFILCFKSYRSSSDPMQRQQRKIVAFGLAIPIFAFIVTNIIARSLNIDFPNLGITATLFFSLFIAYAVTRYDLFSVDTTLAAENIIAAIPDSFILADPDGKIGGVNDSLVDLLGYSAMEATSLHMPDLLCQEEKCNWNNIVHQLTEHSVLRNFELKFLTKTGDKKTVLFSGSFVRSKSGKPIALTCFIKDITGRIEMEQRLLKSEQLASIGELARQIGHDLRNPLAAIKNGVYLIKKNASSMTAERRIEVCGWIEDAISDSDRIISSLVDYASDLHLEVEYATPKSLTVNAISKMKTPEKIKIANLCLDEPKLLVDTKKMEAGFERIIQNAFDAMPEGGVLSISSHFNKANVKITFADSGVGVPESLREKLFTPLVTTKAKGMGMSLAICKRLVDAHEGTLTYESVKGQGSTFTFTLPLHHQAISAQVECK
jgi:PAS domain S-box-containing protein